MESAPEATIGKIAGNVGPGCSISLNSITLQGWTIFGRSLDAGLLVGIT